MNRTSQASRPPYKASPKVNATRREKNIKIIKAHKVSARMNTMNALAWTIMDILVVEIQSLKAITHYLLHVVSLVRIKGV